MHSFKKKLTGAGDYQQIRDEAESSHTSSDRKGGALRFLVGDAEKRIAQDREIVQDELPGIRNKIGTTLESAQTIRQKGEYNDHHISAFITRVNEVKTWIDDHKNALGISMQEYQNLRRGYRDARNTLGQHQGTRTSFASALAAMDMSGQMAPAMRATPEEMNRLKQDVVDQAILFLNKTDTKLRSWNSSGDSSVLRTSSSHASSNSEADPTYTRLYSSSEGELGETLLKHTEE